MKTFSNVAIKAVEAAVIWVGRYKEIEYRAHNIAGY